MTEAAGPARRVVVVGASAAGARCASRLKRLQPEWSVTMVDESTVYSYAACGLPYVLSGDIDALDELRKTSYGVSRGRTYFENVKRLRVLEGYRVTGVDAEAGILKVRGPAGELELPWDELVLATGAEPVALPGQPEHPRVRRFHTWNDVKPLKRGLIEGSITHVAVVGAGLVGLELAEAFRSLWGAEVTLIEAGPHPMPLFLDREAGALVSAELTGHGVRVLCGRPVRSIKPDGEGVTVRTGDDAVRADHVVVAVGVRPRVELARSFGVELGPTGAIAVDERLATSVPHVWAAGDCIEVRHAVNGEPVHCPLGSLANRQGRVLADILAGREDRFGPVAGALAVKVFDLNVAAAGLSLARARELGLGAAAVWMTTDDRAHYWPESENLYLQAVFEEETLRLLGVQTVGKGRAVDAVDLAAQVLLEGGSVDELGRLEHCYAPPFAPALAPVAVLGFVARNHAEGIRCVSPLAAPAEAEGVLDVRLREESAARPWAGGDSVHIPLEELSCRVGELDRGRRWLVICERGTRSQEAARRLASAGYRARYLGGGMLWRTAAGGGVS